MDFSFFDAPKIRGLVTVQGTGGIFSATDRNFVVAGQRPPRSPRNRTSDYSFFVFALHLAPSLLSPLDRVSLPASDLRPS